MDSLLEEQNETNMNTIALNEIKIEDKEQQQIKLNTGIEESARGAIAEGLQKLLADSYCLMVMTQNYHWNVQGMGFRDLHLITEEHYTELFGAIDVIAERVRALGFLVDGTLKDFNDATDINIPNNNLRLKGMIADLLKGHETVVRTARSVVELSANASDEVTVDLLTQRMESHEKTAWMLRSMLEQ